MASGRLLVLDDDPTVGKLLVMVAQTVGFEARLCEHAPVFFQTVNEWRPTHVAIDLSMPDMDGLQVLDRLAADECRSSVIISSGAGRAEIDAALLHARSLNLVTVGVLPKPFSVSSLRKLLLADANSEQPGG